jgi:hypothetical protein
MSIHLSKSRHKTRHQILGVLAEANAESLLMDWANLAGTWPQLESGEAIGQAISSIKRMCFKYPRVFEECVPTVAILLGYFLRNSWEASDLRHRDWYMFKFRDYYQQTIVRVRQVSAVQSPGRIPPAMPVIVPASRAELLEAMGTRNNPPPITPIEAAAFYFQQNARRARRCLNEGCPAPYFLAKKKGQKFCGEECAKPTQREAKRKWWNENRGKQAIARTKARRRKR